MLWFSWFYMELVLYYETLNFFLTFEGAIPWDRVTLGNWVCSLTPTVPHWHTKMLLHFWALTHTAALQTVGVEYKLLLDPDDPFPLKIGHLFIPPYYLCVEGQDQLSIDLTDPRMWEVKGSGLNCLILAGLRQKLNSPRGPLDTRRKEVGQVDCHPIPFPLPPCASWGGCSAVHAGNGGAVCRHKSVVSPAPNCLRSCFLVNMKTRDFSSPLGFRDTEGGKEVKYILAFACAVLFYFIDIR